MACEVLTADVYTIIDKLTSTEVNQNVHKILGGVATVGEKSGKNENFSRSWKSEFCI
mgnify:CR=1 FL=1